MDTYKTCTKCGKELPATTEYFQLSKLGKEGLKSYCKSCVYEQTRTVNGLIKNFNRHSRHRFPKEKYISELTYEQFKTMLIYFDFKCAYTGQPLDDTNFSLDHVKTRTRGGIHHAGNIVPCTISINKSKGPKDFLEWYVNTEYFTLERLIKILNWQTYAFNEWGY